MSLGFGLDRKWKIQSKIGPINSQFFSEAKETRRRLLWQLFLTLIDANRDVFGNDRRIFVYDCAYDLFCAKDLGTQVGETREFIVEVDRVSFYTKNFYWKFFKYFQDALEPRCKTYIRNRQRILAHMQRTGTVNLRDAYNDVAQGDSTVVGKTSYDYLIIQYNQFLNRSASLNC